MEDFKEYKGLVHKRIKIFYDEQYQLKIHKDKYVFSGKLMMRNHNNDEDCFYVRGVPWGMHTIKRKNRLSISNITNNELNGYSLYFLNNNITSFIVWDMGCEIERIELVQRLPIYHSLKITRKDLEIDQILRENPDVITKIKAFNGLVSEIGLINLMGDIFENQNDKYERLRAMKTAWAYDRKRKIQQGYYKGKVDIVSFYSLQNELRSEVVRKNELPPLVQFIAGVDVAYNDLEKRMIGAIVVLKADTLEVVEQAYHEMDITFPYIPGLFSFREIPPIIEAYKKLTIKPDLIVCDGQGIAHPKGVGMATHLGIELDIPTIGCAKKRLVGAFDKGLLNKERGSKQSLIWDSEEVGVALRTQTDIKPMFVSIGHKIDLETSVEWVLKLCTQYRLPETTRQADQLVNGLMKERTEIDLYDEDH